MKKTLLGLVTLFGLSTFALPAFAQGAPAATADTATAAPAAKKVKKVRVKKGNDAAKSPAPKGRRHLRRHAGHK